METEEWFANAIGIVTTVEGGKAFRRHRFIFLAASLRRDDLSSVEQAISELDRIRGMLVARRSELEAKLDTSGGEEF
ncbi:hypothetical protein FQN54_003368 [Arachnomyces sp. PD_36]|nr:hypothetical protein FQN54_003368 [Arachnomyces sp. PD_36]